MKITERSNGVTIRCTAGDWEMIQYALASLEDEIAVLPKSRNPLTANAKRAFRKRTSGGALARIDVPRS